MPRTHSRPKGGFFFALLAALAAFVTPASAATLLPNGKQTFIDQNGAPLSQGTVTFYIPGTTTPKATWQNSGQTILNTNPVALDSSGQAVIYGSGCYRQIVKDHAGNTIWDQPTCDTSNSQLSWGGQAGGTANAITVTAANFTSGDGQSVSFIATNTNTAAANVNGVNVLKDTVSGTFSLSGGEIVSGNLVQLVYDTSHGAFHLVNNPVIGSSPKSMLTAGATSDLGSATSRYVSLTGSTTISSFGSSASLNFPLYTLTFTGTNTLVNSASLGLPGNANITTAIGDYAQAVYLGSGNWRIIDYQRATGASVIQGSIFMGVSSCPWTPPTVGGLLPARVDVEMVGGGGGGGGNGGDGAAGGASSFNGVTVGGGAGGVHSTNSFGVDGGLGGSGGSGAVDLRLPGQAGAASGANEGAAGVGAAGVVAGSGGRAAASFSWGGAWSSSNNAARQNGGYGGGGAGWAAGGISPGSSSGGGGGEYARLNITNPAVSIACAIGAGGTAGTSAGTGGSGIILTRSFWQ
jgi:hypothetical protein